MENEKDYQGIANLAYNAYIIAYQSQFLTSVIVGIRISSPLPFII